ncbi:MAG: diguanylate cyclase [Thermodesulfobacteriota bacterium]
MRILVAEDDPITRKLLEAHLGKWGHEVTMCLDGDAAWDILSRDDAPKMAILDWMMPGKDGVTLCRNVRGLERQQYTYIILLTAKTRKEDVIEGLEAGADDYIAKPFDAHELQVRVRTGVRILRLQEDLMSALAASEYQATHDALTGLWNRRSIMRALETELARAEREDTEVGVIMADVDHFKRINDTFGHMAGDAVLVEVAARFTRNARPYDVIGRYGGEEFLIVCPGCDLDSCGRLAERLRQALSESPVTAQEASIDLTMSFGVSARPGGDTRNAELIIKEADQALYRAKELGRNRVEFWSDMDLGAEANPI